MNDIFVKICGVTRLADAQHAVREGATAVGFVFWPKSPRAIGVEQAREIVAALPSTVTTVGVFVDESMESIRRVVEQTGIRAVQLHGDEAPEDAETLGVPLLRSVTLDTAADAARAWPDETTLILDASDPVRRGGTGTTVDWTRAAGVARQRRIVLAGGLTPLNVDEAVRIVRPYGVDVSSGVERTPGVKDEEKVSSFVVNARRALAQLASASPVNS